jgi:light-regulated signal transduction histidine kinase (bacteriophytochrome)
MQAGRALEFEERSELPGRSITWLTTKFPLRDAQGKIYAVAGISADISQRKQAEEALRKSEATLLAANAALQAANRELETFTYATSHDLRAPVNRMHGFAHVLLNEHAAEMSNDARHCVDMIHESAEHLGKLINSLLHFSRLSQQPLTHESVNTRMLVDDVLRDMAAQLQGRRVEILVGELPAVPADPQLFKQVWVNLLSNAIKFTRGRDPAVIEVGHEMRDGTLVYFVRDNGSGFDMRYADKLFTVFQRLHREEDFEGVGVGLAFVQRIVNRHGGRIWAQGMKDEGATFYFTLGDARAHEQ